jgi:death on curing protein
VRDFTELAAALARPQQDADSLGAGPGLWEQAAVLMQALGHSYPLVAGNKRLTWNATWFFLGVNGIRLGDPLDDGAAQRFMYELARGQLTIAGIVSRPQKFAG